MVENEKNPPAQAGEGPRGVDADFFPRLAMKMERAYRFARLSADLAALQFEGEWGATQLDRDHALNEARLCAAAIRRQVRQDQEAGY